jgi:ABC-2 type transport system permease protein
MKNFILDRWNLLKAAFVFTFQKETAYWANNWGSVLSTTFYTLAMLVFINVLYAKVKLVAGYDKNDMLLFFLVGQAAFYTNYGLSVLNLQDFIQEVNRGDLDLILTKPLPALFYITFKRIRVFSVLRDGIPPTLAIIFSINWSVFHPSFLTLFEGFVVFICGLIALHSLEFLAMLPVFWLGESKSILKGVLDLYGNTGGMLPLEGFGQQMRLTLTSILPVLIPTGFTTSVLLGKSEVLPLLLWSLLIAGIGILTINLMWNVAIRNYTSASS